MTPPPAPYALLPFFPGQTTRPRAFPPNPNSCPLSLRAAGQPGRSVAYWPRKGGRSSESKERDRRDGKHSPSRSPERQPVGRRWASSDGSDVLEVTSKGRQGPTPPSSSACPKGATGQVAALTIGGRRNQMARGSSRTMGSVAIEDQPTRRHQGYQVDGGRRESWQGARGLWTGVKTGRKTRTPVGYHRGRATPPCTAIRSVGGARRAGWAAGPASPPGPFARREVDSGRGACFTVATVALVPLARESHTLTVANRTANPRRRRESAGITPSKEGLVGARRGMGEGSARFDAHTSHGAPSR